MSKKPTDGVSSAALVEAHDASIQCLDASFQLWLVVVRSRSLAEKDPERFLRRLTPWFERLRAAVTRWDAVWGSVCKVIETAAVKNGLDLVPSYGFVRVTAHELVRDRANLLAAIERGELLPPPDSPLKPPRKNRLTAQRVEACANIIEFVTPIPKEGLMDDGLIARLRQEHLAAVRECERDRGRTASANEGAQRGVDFPNPSAPLTKKDAADAWGGNMTARKLTELMATGKVRYRSISRQRWVFCRDDVPNLPER